MERRLVIVAVAAVVVAGAATLIYSPSQTSIPLPPPTRSSGNATSGVQLIAKNLEVPWAIDQAPDGRLFLTERIGKIRITEPDGTLLSDPAAYINAAQNGEAGLLGLALDPNFSANHRLYIYHTYTNGTTVFNKVLALTEKDNKIVDSKVILDGIPASSVDDGGRIKFGPDGKLYVGTGDAGRPDLAQNAKSLAGKILRINSDGSIPSDNPFVGSPVYSYGHRNVQGLAWDPLTKQMYEAEPGETGNDEINLIKAGANYGWPIEQCDATRFEKPILCFNPGIEPGGITIAASHRLGYNGTLLMASLRGEELRQINLSNGEQNTILTGFGRIRDVIEASDGSIYVLTSNKDGNAIPSADDDKILRLTSPT